jgi:hypothetical protein
MSEQLEPLSDEELYSANVHRRVDGIVLVKTGACRPGEAYCHPIAYNFISAMVDEIAGLKAERDVYMHKHRLANEGWGEAVARLAKAEAVCNAVAKHFTSEYASSNWEIRNATRAAIHAWRASRGEVSDE